MLFHYNGEITRGNFYGTEKSKSRNGRYTVRVNGKNPYIIKCKYEAIDGTVHIFKSRNLFFNPESVLKGTRVKVYTDRINYKKYYVDIDEVLPNIKIH